jgi:Uma2 family endonuclease
VAEGTRRQAFLAAKVCFELAGHERSAGVGYATAACGVILGPNTVRGVDAGYFIDNGEGDAWATTPPRLAVHVLGPEDIPAEVTARVEDFLLNGTPLVWLIDPETRTVNVFRPLEPRGVLSDELNGGDELPGFACKVADLFRMPGQPAANNTPV